MTRFACVYAPEDYDRPSLAHGSGGGWQDQPDPEKPLAIIHLPGGKRHEVKPPERRRIGFKG